MIKGGGAACTSRGGGGGAGVTQPSPLIFPSPPRAEKAQLLLDTTLIFRILGWKSFMWHALAGGGGGGGWGNATIPFDFPVATKG